ncbi:MAG: methyltransferase domain-containing protein [Eubacteriales bacterium]|nr:methyltransferase domain-containing protein [Eubacteriales bacterium]
MDAAYKQQWLRDEAQAFSGWDFSYLDGRWHEDGLPWDYAALAQAYRRDDMTLLDMETGGGECLLSLGHPAARTVVTEGWPPNVALCRQKLAPLGIRVEEVPDPATDPLPFADSTFDLVLNRHGSYDAAEIHRVLKSGGIFLTQQVGGENDRSLSERLLADLQPPYSDFCLKGEVRRFCAAGFDILDRRETRGTITFFDVGAVVYFAKVIPWEFPGFSVEGCYPALCRLQQEWEQNGVITTQTHRFLLAARKK